MARKFSELENKMSGVSRVRSDALYRTLLAEMPLHELRRARGLSQETLANLLHIKQSNIAKLEKRTDMYISTLRSTIEAMGGALDIVARFPDGAIKINSFSSIEDEENSPYFETVIS